jgi:DNA-binding NtrC family response regulator
MGEEKILVIEEDENIRKNLKNVLAGEDYIVETALNGEEGLKKAEEARPDLVLLELELSGMDGIEVLKQLKKLRLNAIVITGSASIESAVEAMKAGAIDYLRKPFSSDEITEVVAGIMGKEKSDESEQEETEYETFIEQAKKMIQDNNIEQAKEQLKQALACKPASAASFNLLGAISEIQGDATEALKRYRAAMALDPSYKPAEENIGRATKFEYSPEGIKIDEETEINDGDNI